MSIIKKICRSITYRVYRLFGYHEVIFVRIKDGSINRLKVYYPFQTRADSFIKMLSEAITSGTWQRMNYSFKFYIGDYPRSKKLPEDTFYYCCESEKDKDRLLPDFIFGSWSQVGIVDYDQTARDISEAGQKPYIYNKMLWIGNSKTHKNRKKFIELAQKHEEIIDGIDTCADKFVEGNKKQRYISLQDHTQYKYLIDIEGNGYSARIGLLLFSKRVLFIQDRRWKQYYYYDLKPYIHYIPIKNDFSDLLQQISFVEKQGEEYYNRIAQNAYEYALNNLKYSDAVSRVRKLIFEKKSDYENL